MEKLSSAELGLPMDEPSPKGEGSSSGGSELETHAGAFLSAMKRGDKKALAEAFRAMKDACDAEGYSNAGSDDFDV